MKKTYKIIISIAVAVLLGGSILMWAAYQKGGSGTRSQFVRDFTDENFEAEVVLASTKGPVVVDFYADWCIPCRMLEPILEEVARDLDGKVTVGRLDTDKNVVARKLGINRIPVVWIVRDGEIKNAFQGVVPKETILKALKDMGS